MADKNQINNVLKYLNENKDSYVIIGGIAAWLNLLELNANARATKDFDIVLCLEINNENFNKNIVSFLKAGGYINATSNKKKSAYRFINPKTPGYPEIVEFFAPEDQIPKALNQYLKKIHITYEEEELSAIILEKPIYDFIISNKRFSRDGLPIITIPALIALKTYAYYQNKALYEAKKIKSENDYKKHKSDIIRLLANMPKNIDKVKLPKILKDSALKFREEISTSTPNIKGLKYDVTPNDLLKVYSKLYE